jgi:hypothetical protein
MGAVVGSTRSAIASPRGRLTDEATASSMFCRSALAAFEVEVVFSPIPDGEWSQIPDVV